MLLYEKGKIRESFTQKLNVKILADFVRMSAADYLETWYRARVVFTPGKPAIYPRLVIRNPCSKN